MLTGSIIKLPIDLLIDIPTISEENESTIPENVKALQKTLQKIYIALKKVRLLNQLDN